MLNEIHNDINSSCVGKSQICYHRRETHRVKVSPTTTSRIFVSIGYEGVDLPQSGDWEPMLFSIEPQLLERDDSPGLRIASTKDNPIRALLDLVQPLVGEHRASRKDWRVARPRWNPYAV